MDLFEVQKHMKKFRPSRQPSQREIKNGYLHSSLNRADNNNNPFDDSSAANHTHPYPNIEPLEDDEESKHGRESIGSHYA